MPFFKRQTTRPIFQPPDAHVLIDRARRLDRTDLFDALEQSVNGLSHHIALYRQTREFDHLGEIMLHSEATYTLANEMAKREAKILGIDQPKRRTRQVRSF